MKTQRLRPEFLQFSSGIDEKINPELPFFQNIFDPFQHREPVLATEDVRIEWGIRPCKPVDPDGQYYEG